jgi:hypothetical protein
MRPAAVVFAVTMSAGLVGLWLYPMGLGGMASSWTALGFAAILGTAFVAGRVTSWPSGALVSATAAVLGVASAWAATKILDPSRPEGELMLFYWIVLGILAGGMHLLGVASVKLTRRVARERA